MSSQKKRKADYSINYRIKSTTFSWNNSPLRKEIACNCHTGACLFTCGTFDGMKTFVTKQHRALLNKRRDRRIWRRWYKNRSIIRDERENVEFSFFLVRVPFCAVVIDDPAPLTGDVARPRATFRRLTPAERRDQARRRQSQVHAALVDKTRKRID